MARWAPARADVLDEIAGEVLHNFPRGHVIVGVDGRTGAGKTTFAADLAAAFASRGTNAVSVSLDAFASDDATRHQGADDARTRYEHGYDYAAFRSATLDPFRNGAAVALEHRSRADDRLLVDPLTWLPESNAVLVVEGSFLLRPETIGIWHSTVWLNVSREASIERSAARDGTDPDAEINRTMTGADDLYIAAVDPVRRAFSNVDMADPEHPRRTFSDSC